MDFTKYSSRKTSFGVQGKAAYAADTLLKKKFGSRRSISVRSSIITRTWGLDVLETVNKPPPVNITSSKITVPTKLPVPSIEPKEALETNPMDHDSTNESTKIAPNDPLESKSPHNPAFGFTARNQTYAVSPSANSPNRACRLPRRPKSTIPLTLCNPLLFRPKHPTNIQVLDKSLTGLCSLPEPTKHLVNLYANGLPYEESESRRIPYRVKILVHTIELLIEFLEIAGRVDSESTELFLDEEGNGHGRVGSLCVIQVTFGSMDTTTFILDVKALGQSLFDTTGPDGVTFKRILEDRSIMKVFFDIRNDSAALYHQYGVHLQGVIDIQIMELALRESGWRWVHGLNKCIQQKLGLSYKEKSDWSMIKNAGHKYCGVDYSHWEKRPMPDVLLAYASNDTVYMPHLYARFQGWLKSSPDLMHLVRVESARRVLESQKPDFESSGSLAPAIFLKWQHKQDDYYYY